MNKEWFDGQFEEGDLRKTAGDLLHKSNEGELDQESKREMMNAYGGMCEMILSKAKDLIEHNNPTGPLVIQYLSLPLSLDDVGKAMTEYYTYHAEFMDVMMTLLMIRTVEAYEPVKNPFVVDFQKGTTSHVE